MKRLLPILVFSLFLAACVDKTGLSADSSRPQLGNPGATVLVTEFTDMECPSCRAAHAVINGPLLQKYGTQIRFEIKHYPIRTLHRYAMDLAEAAECAADQGKFWEFLDLMYSEQTKLEQAGKQMTAKDIDAWGVQLQLDTDLWGRCRKSHIKQDTILADYNSGRDNGVTGTPTYFVNAAKVTSRLDDLSQAIDAALQGAAQRL